MSLFRGVSNRGTWSDGLQMATPPKAYSTGRKFLFAKLMNKPMIITAATMYFSQRGSLFFLHLNRFYFVCRSFTEPFDFKMVHRVNPIFFKYLLLGPSIGCTSRVKYPARWVPREFRRDGRLQGHHGSPQETAFISPQTCPLQSVQEMRTTTACTA